MAMGVGVLGRARIMEMETVRMVEIVRMVGRSGSFTLSVPTKFLPSAVITLTGLAGMVVTSITLITSITSITLITSIYLPHLFT